MKIRLLNQKYTLGELWKLRKPLFGVLLQRKKMINFLRGNLPFRFNKENVPHYPYTLMIEPTSLCDLNCPMCPIVLNKTSRNRGHMDFKIFKKVIDEIGDYLVSIELWNYGEPLLNKDLFKMIKYAKKKKIITVMSSNMHNLNEEKVYAMVNSGLDYLIISFDGASKETFEKYRGQGSDFNKVVNNVKNLVAAKKRLKKINPFINLQFIVMRHNEEEISQIKELAKEFGVDKLSLKKFTYIGENIESFLPKNKEYVLGKIKGETKMMRCSRPWHSSVINWNGQVIPCCGDLDFKFIFGDISKQKFLEIWNNKKYQNFRKLVLENINSIKMCQTCPSTDFTTDMFIE